MTSTLRFITNFLVPGGLLVAAAVALQAEPVVLGAAKPYVPFVSYASLAMAALLSWYYDQARPLASASAITLSVMAAALWPDPADPGRMAVAVTLPASLWLVAVTKERGVLTGWGILLTALHGAGVWAVTTLAERQPAWTAPPWASPAAFAVTLVTLATLAVARRSKIEYGLCWSCLAAFLGLSQPDRDVLAGFAGAAGLALVFAVLEHGLEIAYRDDLTGLPSRRASRSTINGLGRTYAIALCDVDHFKQFNDRYGHEAGNRALRMVAEKLSQVGGGGRVFRYGGEEFLIVFKGRTAAEAEPLIQALREVVSATPVPLAHASQAAGWPAPANVSVSIGVAERCDDHETPDLVIEAADAALYRAKGDGRDCVRLASTRRVAV